MELNGKEPQADLENNIPPTTPGHWTATRREIQSWLHEQAPSLAELYESSVCLIFEISIPGRVRLISHCVREICNQLVEVKVGKKDGGRFSYVERMEQLAKIWKEQGLSIDGVFPESGINSHADLPSSSPDISITRPVFIEIANLIKDHVKTSDEINHRVELFFKKCVPENQLSQYSLLPLVNQWKNLTKWFVGKAYDNGTVEANYNEQSLLYHFQLFEQVMSTLAQSFYKTTDEIDDILEEANSSTD
ncbi:hypothetical protein [Anabaena azotica]|uniref:Uncharacterized protein n=1 Tax=Anabaena azotica FACHB-119 TaxID=947527 RepID=A0ABR8DBS2_9NOST|nr:hypothetical protein [Anabaena azotica]MBD2504675.1 hypothetical protein [Anabaena azotica FACHB-119]